jgi:plasmid stabilization system protein ParE
LFYQELAAVLNLLSKAPGLGRRYTRPSVAGVRRILLRSTRYHIYYVVHEDTVLVLAVWNAHRGTGPDLLKL